MAAMCTGGYPLCHDGLPTWRTRLNARLPAADRAATESLTFHRPRRSTRSSRPMLVRGLAVHLNVGADMR